MIKLLKQMKLREALSALLCALLVVCQIYFDLALPDYMSDLTLLIKTPGSTVSQIWSKGLPMLGCVLISAALAVACGFLAARTAAGFSFTIREKVFSKVIGLSMQEMQAFSIPSLINRTTNDINQIQMLLAVGLQMIIKAPVMAVWAIIKIVGKSWELSLVTAGFVAAILTVMITVMFVLLPRFKRVQRMMDDINRIARENLSGISVVHAFNAEDCQNAKFDSANSALIKTQLFNQRTFALLMPTLSFAMNGLALAIYWVGAALINNLPAADMLARLSSFSNVIVFSTYATYVVMSLMMLVMVFMFLPAAAVSASRINEVLDSRSSISEGGETRAEESGTLEFRNVSFRYPDSGENGLNNISFKVSRGETVAFIGATGSGKTTLVSLIARMYDVTQGEILIDGINIKDYTFDALYDRIGYVTQKAVMFSGTISENVAFGEAACEVTDEDVAKALRLAKASEFVDKLEKGTGAPVAQGGVNFSGGQKQRLSIARALARKPEILIFDDSFSALDYATDKSLRLGLAKELGDTTKLIVAQRIGSIRNADRIIVLDDGCAVGIGTHEQLLESCDVYREIVLSQLSGDELNK